MLRDEHAMRVALATALRHDGNAIDVGANQGDTLEMILAVAPDGRHIAYEPIPDWRSSSRPDTRRSTCATPPARTRPAAPSSRTC